MTDSAQKYIVVAVILLAGIGSTTYLVSLKLLDPSVFSVVVGGSVTGILAWLNAPNKPIP
jgi:hypothetical protein